ncbi:hypothetical protein [Prevotella sp.]|uniref:hypothetical protein n=1 Tax=Prevotella sp. TaxID=59823 RepID=UPI003F7E35FA
MKTEEINPGDILYEKERNLLVKVARVDEDGVVKCSAYTDMERIFKTVPPPYRIGTHTADAYIPATDVQRKYMERNLAVCKYVNLPKNNRMETLAYIIADLKAENVELEQRVHQLMDDYNDVVRQLNEKEKQHDEKTPKQTSFDMNQLRYHCDTVEMMNKELERFAKAIHSFVKDNKIYMKKGTSCGYKQGHPAVSSTVCLECKSCLGIIEGCGVICEARLLEANVSFPKND